MAAPWPVAGQKRKTPKTEILGVCVNQVGYVRQVRRLGAQADDFLTDPSVRCIHKVARAVARELHRLKGLARYWKHLVELPSGG